MSETNDIPSVYQIRMEEYALILITSKQAALE